MVVCTSLKAGAEGFCSGAASVVSCACLALNGWRARATHGTTVAALANARARAASPVGTEEACLALPHIGPRAAGSEAPCSCGTAGAVDVSHLLTATSRPRRSQCSQSCQSSQRGYRSGRRAFDAQGRSRASAGEGKVAVRTPSLLQYAQARRRLAYQERMAAPPLCFVL
jgi:hypothetical protein